MAAVAYGLARTMREWPGMDGLKAGLESLGYSAAEAAALEVVAGYPLGPEADAAFLAWMDRMKNAALALAG